MQSLRFDKLVSSFFICDAEGAVYRTHAYRIADDGRLICFAAPDVCVGAYIYRCSGPLERITSVEHKYDPRPEFGWPDPIVSLTTEPAA